MCTFAAKMIRFNSQLDFSGTLPANIRIMNPFKENECATPASEAFYHKYYNDCKTRRAILGINPGRFGAGITGVPFTDPERLGAICDIHIAACPDAREPSSVFVYEMIQSYGGVSEFYAEWYINSVCPLGFLRRNDKDRWVNYNYYDSVALQKAATPFIAQTLNEQMALGLDAGECFCFGKGRNYQYLKSINKQYGFFRKIVPLDHPRYIIQYKSNQTHDYAKNYAEIFRESLKQLPLQ